ncbi:MAG: DUF3047 domain-containing protein [Colwellia sp.]|nr:DUF3047 domain-containing protein [Colwellia sp.]
MSDSNTNISRRKAMGAIAGIAACVPCAAVFSATKNQSSVKQSENFHQRIGALVKKASADIVRSVNFSITPNDLPWSQQLGKIEAGQSVTFLLSGRWWILKEHNYWVDPGVAFYARISGGTLYNAANNTGTMLADRDGTLEIARTVGQFKNAKGELFPSEEQYKAAEGLIEGIAIIWQADALDGLSQLSAAGDVDGLILAELNRINYQKLLPTGWHYMYMFGDSGIFSEGSNGELQCNTHKNVGILQYAINAPLTADLKLDWQWLVDKLPSQVAEDQILTHDYLSIAVEFDDGKDITYMWSAELPEGSVFQCPLPRWAEYETHIVQRSGKKFMGKKVKESRNIYNDYQEHIGGSANYITRIWLIANTVFMRGTGRCSYSDILLTQNGQKTKII